MERDFSLSIPMHRAPADAVRVLLYKKNYESIEKVLRIPQDFFLFNRCDTFQFDRNRCWQGVDLNRCSARLVILKILCVNFIEGLKIILHVREEDGNIHQVFPTRTGSFQNEANVLKYGMTLFFNI